MNNTLDSIENKNNQRTFSILSFILSLVTLGIFIYLIFILPRVLRVSGGFPIPPLTVIIFLYVSFFLGMISTIVSFIKKEPNSFYKWLGAVINIILFIFLISNILFATLI